MKYKLLSFISILIASLVIAGQAFAAGNIDPIQKYSQALSVDIDHNGLNDFLNWAPTNTADPVVVSDISVTGIIWGESLGWIKLNPDEGSGTPLNGVRNNCFGQLSGWAWSGDSGSWINFAPSGATVPAHIDLSTGKISGQVWVSGNHGGWYELSSPQKPTPTDPYDPALGLVTSWRPSATCSLVGVCGAANGVGTATQPTANLCGVGSSTTVVDDGNGHWTWLCVNGGGNVTCSAPKSGDKCSAGGCPQATQTLKVITTVVNTGGGTLLASDFITHVKDLGQGGGLLSAVGDSGGHTFGVPASNFLVSEDPVTNYTVSFAGGCDSSGQITIGANSNSTCTVINTYSKGPNDTYCTDSSATNYGYVGPCTYPSKVCTDSMALNYNDPLPCRYPGPKLCQDPNALNEGQLLPCVYPKDQVCQDRAADNYGNPLPCTYTGICLDRYATNQGSKLPCTYPPNTCRDAFANNYGSPLPCKYSKNDVLATTDNGGGGARGGFPLIPILTAIGIAGLLSTIPGLVGRIGNMILTFAFGRKKMRGIVFSSITKEPLDPVYVSVIDMVSGLEVANQITDMEGRFGFVLQKGHYKIVANKTDYLFPSAKLAGRPSDEVYDHLYFGEAFTVENPDNVVTMNIPMDPVGQNWNQQEKRRSNFIEWFIKGQTKFGWLFQILFVLGFAVSGMITYFYPVWWNILMLAIYVILALVQVYGYGAIEVGKVLKQGVPLSYAIIHVFNANLNHEIARKVTSVDGGYYALVSRGKYYVTIDQKNPDGTYTQVYTSPIFRSYRGVIDQSFDL